MGTPIGEKDKSVELNFEFRSFQITREYSTSLAREDTDFPAPKMFSCVTSLIVKPRPVSLTYAQLGPLTTVVVNMLLAS